VEILFSLGLVALAYGIAVFLLWKMNNEQPIKRGKNERTRTKQNMAD